MDFGGPAPSEYVEAPSRSSFYLSISSVHDASSLTQSTSLPPAGKATFSLPSTYQNHNAGFGAGSLLTFRKRACTTLTPGENKGERGSPEGVLTKLQNEGILTTVSWLSSGSGNVAFGGRRGAGICVLGLMMHALRKPGRG